MSYAVDTSESSKDTNSLLFASGIGNQCQMGLKIEVILFTFVSSTTTPATTTLPDVGTTPKDVYQTFKSSTYLEFG